MADKRDVPRGDARGFVQYLRYDMLSGFLVFLIALPLCLGIATASGFPPIAGVFTAIVGAFLATFLSDSELTIKGPAAGLIVIVLGCIEEFGGDGMLGGFSSADAAAYRCALAVAVVAGAVQIVFGLVRAGILGEFFPISAVHGMLAAIGVIIISKQIPVALGVQAKGEPLNLLMRVPEFVLEANPAIAVIGAVSIGVMFLWPLAAKRFRPLQSIPAPLVVLLATIPLGMAFDLVHEHSYSLQGHRYQLSDQYLVAAPDRIFGMFDSIAFPDFHALLRPFAWKWVAMFFVIGSLESLLSAKAIELLDPWKRKSNLDRDMAAVGAANVAAAMVGGLPMISEIVRSKANIDNGARTRFANFWHGVFLLVCVALIPMVLHRIPMAALAGMLVYTGFRLAHPSEFVHVYHLGREQLAVFCTTLVAVLATDLLIGVAIGIALKIVIHLINGAPLRSLFKPYLVVEQQDERTCVIRAKQSAVFTNWIPFRRQIEDLGLVQRQNVVLDLSDTKLVDHSVMDKLHEMQRDFEQEGLALSIVGLEAHQPLASHERAARRRRPTWVRRITIAADADLLPMLTAKAAELGGTVCTVLACAASAAAPYKNGVASPTARVRIEVLADVDACEAITAFLRREVPAERTVTACIETIELVRTPGAANGVERTFARPFIAT